MLGTRRKLSKQKIVAMELLDEGNLAVSVQVLQEFYSQVTRVTRPMPDDAMSRCLYKFFASQFWISQIHPITLEIFHSAIAISQRFQLSYWDGAILAAARALGCDAVYSEDMSSEQDYDGLRVINPFAIP